MEVTEPCVTPRPRQVAANSSKFQHQYMDSTNDTFKFYSLSITLDIMVKHLENKNYLRWPKKIVSDLRT